MPLVISEDKVQWIETMDRITVTVPLPERYSNTASIRCSQDYLQLSAAPYFWECFLAKSINSDRSLARIGDEFVSFELLKENKGMWGALKNQNSGDKQWCKEMREKALREIEVKTKQEEERSSREKHEKRREAVRKQMELDEKERSRISSEEDAAKQRMVRELEQWRCESSKSVERAPSCGKQKKKTIPLPPPRTNGEISVTFSPRVFPTAARESLEHEEHDWLESQKAAMKSLNFDCADLSEHEKNPVWLEMKGDSLRGNGDFRGAVNAYSLAIRMNPTKPSLYSKRASCHFDLNNLHKAIEDSSKALELLNPRDSSNDSTRFEAHMTRGKSFVNLELYVQGLMDFEVALKIDPNHERLKEEADRIRAQISTNSS